MAQISINSPYSRYGYGLLSDQAFGNSIGMGGTAIGVRSRFHINPVNPASYTAVDSITFMFDLGMSLQNSNFVESPVKTNAKNASFDYIAMQFRFSRRLAFSAGYIPFSNVGYNMSKKTTVTSNEYGDETYSQATYKGEGGLQQLYVGLAYKVLPNLSVGTNASLLYGDISHTVSTQFSNTAASISAHGHQISASDLKFDVGAQYTHRLADRHELTLGLIYGFGSDLSNTEGYNFTHSVNTVTTAVSELVDTIRNAFQLPATIGAGLAYTYNNQLTVGLDVKHQNWNSAKYFGEEGYFNNRTRVSLGAEYQPDVYGRKFFGRIRYRLGGHYTKSYTKTADGSNVNEYGASFGFGIPLFLYNSRTYLNLSGEYVHVQPKQSGLLEENYLRINVGITFNERWFMKWKVE
ncbi:MAG: hypothetical protein Q4E55_03365 [Bacteroidales bacterium]|nr:hypothetical protein [Bacteroidales bacterium]